MPKKAGRDFWSTEQWEAHLGEQIRRARIDEELSQLDLARLANVNRNSVSALERGSGSSLTTLIRVLRALGRSEWLDTLAPDPGPSPLALLREQQARDAERNRRVRSASTRQAAGQAPNQAGADS